MSPPEKKIPVVLLPAYQPESEIEMKRPIVLVQAPSPEFIRSYQMSGKLDEKFGLDTKPRDQFKFSYLN